MGRKDSPEGFRREEDTGCALVHEWASLRGGEDVTRTCGNAQSYSSSSPAGRDGY